VIKIGDFDCIPLGEVRDIASKYRGMVNKNIDPLAKRDTAKELPTLREFSKTYIEWARFHKRSWKDDDNKLKADILPAFGERKLNGITGKEIQLYLEKIKTRTSGSCSNRPELLSSGYQWKGTAIITNKIGSPTNGKYAATERRRAMTTCLGARQRRSGSGPC
jgi:hypothetical protein